ncbi:MAG: aminopeptidase [Candidatus Bathyarchaeia archaeon]
MDPRISEHARILVEYSTKVREGDRVVIQINDYGRELATEVYKEAARRGASPLIIMVPTEALRGYYELAPEEYLQVFPEHYYELVKASDVFIHILSEENTRYLSNVDPKRISVRSLATKKITDERLKKRWCVTQFPTPAQAHEAEMSLREYEDFLYSAVLRDWKKEAEKMNRLRQIMNKADTVQIIGDETDLTMAIRGRNAVVSDGTHNLPGGEVFTAPLEDSVNGEIFFDLPAIKYGREVTGIRLKFAKGEIVNYSANKNEDLLRAMINTDEGSKRLGELGIGTNRGINRFTKNILFDEKMAGTIHLALGNAYKECGGTNQSAIHWDMIKTMKTGKILLDGENIQEKFKWEK